MGDLDAEVGVSGSPWGEGTCPKAATPGEAEALERSRRPGRRRSAEVPLRCAQRGHSAGQSRRRRCALGQRVGVESLAVALGARVLGGSSPASRPPSPRVRPAALMEVQTFGGGRGCRDCARRFPYRKRALEPIVGPQPPGPPGQSDMAAHRQWAAARYFKGCPAQSAAPPCEATSAVFMGRGPIFLFPRDLLLSRLAGVQVEPRLPRPSPPSPPPSPLIPISVLLWRMCRDPGVIFGLRRVTLFLGKAVAREVKVAVG